MSHGNLNLAQREAIRPYIQGRRVFDLGAGQLELAKELLTMEPRSLVAIDRLPMPMVWGITRIEGLFTEAPEATDVAFLSWPINWDSGLLRLVLPATTIIYLGKNTDGTACGYPALWRHFLHRPVLAHVPDRQNTLIVYGSAERTAPRTELLLEERGALYQEEILAYEDAV